MKQTSWLDLPLTEIEAEVWTLRFDPDRLRTITQIEVEGGHPNAGGSLLVALKKLQARGPGMPPNSEEQELITLALRVTAEINLERAYAARKLQVRRFSQRIRHLRFHQD